MQQDLYGNSGARLGSSYFGNFNLRPQDTNLQSPFDTGDNDKIKGSGLRGLPSTFAGWEAPARYSFFPSLQYNEGLQPIADFFQGQMGQDYTSELFNQSKDRIATESAATKRRIGQAQARSGQTGAGVSMMAQYMLQNESAARAGQLGTAARQAVLLNQAMQSSAAQQYAGVLGQQYNAMLTPANFQAQRPITQPQGESSSWLESVGPILSGLGGTIGALV